MKAVWRWLKRLISTFLALLLGLLSPVAYSEIACRPSGEFIDYDAIIDTAHHRPETRTLMTYPEWHIVHAYEDFGHVLKTGDPHDFEFIRAISGFWGSLCALSKSSAAHGEIDAATKQMVYVIGISFTVELLLKASYEETMGRLATIIRGSERSVLDDLSATQAMNYATFLQQTPWYKWDFESDVRSLSKAGMRGLRNKERRLALGLEYRAKAAYAGLIAKAVSQAGPDELTLRMIVTDISAQQLAQIDGVRVIAKSEAGIEIETIRYRALTHLIEDMVGNDVNFVEIAGNDDIMFTVLSNASTHPNAIYSSARQGFGDYRHLVLVPVGGLSGELQALVSGQTRLEHVHDY